VSALGALNAGVTTVLDWSHIGNSPEHTDAAISGLREDGIRAVYAYGGGAPGPASRWPGDIRRLRPEHFSAAADLLTLAIAAGRALLGVRASAEARVGAGRAARRSDARARARRVRVRARRRRARPRGRRGGTGRHVYPLLESAGRRMASNCGHGRARVDRGAD